MELIDQHDPKMVGSETPSPVRESSETAVNDPLLRQIQQSQEKILKPGQRREYDKIMAAGLKLMFSDQTFPEMKQAVQTIKSPQQIPSVVAHGIVKVISIVFNASQGKMSMEVSVPAAIALMAHALEYVEQATKIQIDKGLVDQTTELLRQGMLKMIQQAYKLSDADFQSVLNGTHKDLPNRRQASAQAAPAGQPQAAQPAPAAPSPQPMTQGA